MPNLKLFLNQNYNSSPFISKLLTVFKTMLGFPFRRYPEFETLPRFRDKTHFPVFEYNPLFITKLTFITYKINH